MNNLSKNGERPNLENTVPTQMGGVTTMNRIITDKKELVKLVSFLVMSDGGVYFPSGKGTNKNYVFIMNTTSLDFVNYAKDILENVCGCKVELRKDYNTDGFVRKQQYRLFTRRHPLFTQMRARIYKENYKSIDSHFMNLLDWESLAIMYMADGCLAKDKRAESYNVTLNTKRLSEGDNMLLAKFLKEKLNLHFNVNKHYNYTYLRLACSDVEYFMKNITKYLLPDFKYKSIRTISPEVSGDDIV